MNSGISPLLLSKTQLSYALNSTVRGTYSKTRPPYRKINLTFNGDIVAAFEKALWQGGSYFKPDSGNEALRCVIGGKFFHLVPDQSGNATVDQIALPAAMDATAPQVWLWQSEKWTIFNDGTNNPMFVDDTNTATQSNWSKPLNFATTTAASFVVPAVGDTTGVTVNFTSVASLNVGDVITVKNFGQFIVQNITGVAVTLINQSATPGKGVPSGTAVSWQHFGQQLPPGRMGAYGLGRNWVSLIDGKQFVASDLVGGSSGTVANNFRDAVLSITENSYLVGGGNFTVPGSVGDIRAMIFQSVLDRSLGQGALQIYTPINVFTCNAPVDRTTWQSLQNPILTESLIGSGGLGQNSTIQINADTFSRDASGIRAVSIATHYFSQDWGNPPISREMSRLIDQDNVQLLQYGSAVYFDNRMLMTASPQADTQGVYHQALIAMNLDPVSSLRGKAPSVYDGTWTGMNVLQLVRGYFEGVDRCFAFTLNVITHTIELWEIMPGTTTQVGDLVDGNNFPIISYIESPSLFANQKGKSQFDLVVLDDGEIQVDNVIGRVDFNVYYKPDQYPCWIPWRNFFICNEAPFTGDAFVPGDPATLNNKPTYQTRIGIGRPQTGVCDTFVKTELRQGRTFQVKIVTQGNVRILGFRAKAVTAPEPKWAPVAPTCNPICGDPGT